MFLSGSRYVLASSKNNCSAHIHTKKPISHFEQLSPPSQAATAPLPASGSSTWLVRAANDLTNNKASDEQARRTTTPTPPTTQAKSGPSLQNYCNTRHTPCSRCCLPSASARCAPPMVGLLPLLESRLKPQKKRTAHRQRQNLRQHLGEGLWLAAQG